MKSAKAFAVQTVQGVPRSQWGGPFSFGTPKRRKALATNLLK